MAHHYELRNQHLWFDDDGLCRIRVNPGADLALSDAQEAVALMTSLANGARYPTFVDVGQMRSISRDCRRYYAGPETAAVESAVALLVRSPLARAMGNFFMGVNRTLYPTRLFTSEDEALAWLRGFLA
jgi:hypothetical protein